MMYFFTGYLIDFYDPPFEKVKHGDYGKESDFRFKKMKGNMVFFLQKNL